MLKCVKMVRVHNKHAACSEQFIISMLLVQSKVTLLPP